MALDQTTQDVISLVEEASGRPVIVQSDPSLRLLASVKIAKGPSPAHVISYNPSVGANADYVICFQCGFILRVFQTPEPERFDLASTWRGRNDAEKLVANQFREAGRAMTAGGLSQIRDQMLNGLILQLRSMPIGLRVDAWLTEHYPALKDQQRAIIGRQLTENMAALSPEVKRMTPAKIFEANAGMNAAFAAFWSRCWQDMLFLQPYKATAHADLGERLLKSWDEVPADAVHDRRLIEVWAEQVGLSSWFEFVPVLGS